MISAQSAVFVGIAVISMASPVPTLTPAATQTATATRSHNRVMKVRPHPKTEAILDELWMTTDDQGRRRLTMTGPLVDRKLQRLFYLIDPATNTYRLIRLTGNDDQDTQRVQQAFTEAGGQVTAESIKIRLTTQREAAEERDRSFKTKIEQGVAPQESRLHVDCRPRVTDEPAMTDHGPAVWEDDQWSTSCDGFAWADIQTWEPARYFFDVLHLNETFAAADWTHYEPSGYTPNSRSGSCWANPQTFIYTTWYQTYCNKTYTSFYHGFDWTVTGNYVNWDFSLYAFGVPRGISITSTASVQANNGNAIWGAQYYEDTQDWLRQWYETFLLSGIITGDAWEARGNSCVTFCDPAPSDVWWCEQGAEVPGTWDWDLCYCRGALSPVLIDLGDDGLDLTSAANGVRFDIMASGRQMQIAWTRGDSLDAFLALDRNQNGTIDDGSELFGNFTAQSISGRKKASPNGFLALAEFDKAAAGGNDDGQISEDDQIYQSLKLWLDKNHNGISESDELESLADRGILSISLHYVASKKTDEFGNLYGFRSYVAIDREPFTRGPMRRQAIDVFLSHLP